MATEALNETPQRRRKHPPEESEREILEATERLLRERPFREVTVGQIMLKTGLKRPAFYAHFRDRNDVIARIVQNVGEQLFEVANAWLRGGRDPDRETLTALRGLAAVYAEHGPVLRALADAAPGDEETENAYTTLVHAFVEATAERIAAEQSQGRIARDLDACETARALVLLNERYLYDTVGRQPPVDVTRVVAVLHRIWMLTLYGPSPGSSGLTSHWSDRPGTDNE